MPEGNCEGIVRKVVGKGVEVVVVLVLVRAAGAYSEPYAPLPGRNNRSCRCISADIDVVVLGSYTYRGSFDAVSSRCKVTSTGACAACTNDLPLVAVDKYEDVSDVLVDVAVGIT